MMHIYGFMRRRPLAAAAIAVWTLSTLISIGGILILPSWRTGPFGIGLPSAMKTFVGQNAHFSMDYPASWVPMELPQGNHGDLEVFSIIAVPGRAWPLVVLARRDFADEDIEKVAAWGEARASRRDPYTAIALAPLATSSLKGMVLDYTWASSSPLFGRVSVRCMDWCVLQEGTGYSLSFCAEQADWSEVAPVFHRMIDSFSIN